MSLRKVKRLARSRLTLEGAGVHLRRAFGFGNTAEFDPFLLLDDFRNDRPQDYRAGFPRHPHRGIETITYVLAGSVEHQDSLGNKGVIRAGEVQWMTAGRGIVHQEMPRGDPDGRMEGFQLWANLPAKLKMTEPRYQQTAAKDMVVVRDGDGSEVRVICGSYGGRRGAIEGVAAEPSYLDVRLPVGVRKTLPVPAGRQAFAYVFEGEGSFCNLTEALAVPTEPAGWSDASPPTAADDHCLVVFDRGDEITVAAGGRGMRFLLVSGTPLGEPVAWYGPIVMNTQAELQQAFAQLRDGTFLNGGRR